MNDTTIDYERSWKRGIGIAIGVFLFTFCYVVIRYNILRDVPFSDIPLYILNKNLALTTTVLIGLSFLIGPLATLAPHKFSRYLPLRKSLGLIGFGAGAVHSVISLILLSPRYYAKFYTTDGALNAIGQFSLLFGVLALVVFTVVAISSLPTMYERLGEARWMKMQHLGYFGYVLVLLHVVVMGASGWMNPQGYAYGFISISLLSALVILIVFAMRIIAQVYGHRERD